MTPKENKQTAVEWLIDWMGKNQYFIGNDLLKAVQEAKEMEKEQIVDAFTANSVLRSKQAAEQYYNKIYTSNNDQVL